MVLIAFRPRFADYALKMKRGAQVVYPKDLGPILTYADIFPGARVLEAGTGLRRPDDRAVPRRRARRAASCPTSSATEHHDAGRARTSRDSSGRSRSCSTCGSGDLERCRPNGGAVRPVRAGPRRSRGRRSRPWPRSWSRAGVLCAYLPTTIQVQQLVLALAGARVPAHRDLRGAAPELARHRAERPAGPPDGRPYRVPHRRARGIV